MRRTVSISIVIVFLLQSCIPYLVENGKTDFTIVLPDSPQPVEQTAAKELKTYLDQITKINWIIASEKEVPEDAPQILVGNSSRAKKFFSEVDPAQIPYDGIEIHLKKNKLLLTGHQQRGTLYAVNTFLEDVFGVRWWTSSEQTIPTYKNFKLKPLDISYAPKLIYRESYYKDAFDPIFATRMKCNGSNEKIAIEYGDHHRFTYFVHSFFPLIPPGKYFADHPEWFSEINGIRKHEQAQLCLMNDDMRKELTKNAIEALRNNPGSKFISISQNDWAGYCTCEKCNKVAEEEDSQSGPLIRFVNAVAEDIEKEFPDVFVETLAYEYTRKPPKYVKPRKNVIVRLCTIECSFVQPLIGEQNKSFSDDMQGWSKIAHQLFIWDYVTNFSSYILPHPNLRVLAPNIRFFVDQGTIGLFEQGDSQCEVGDFVRMRNWVISHLMWNPALDEKKLIQEFLIGYYGNKATTLLMEFFDTLLNKAESTNEHIGCFHDNTDNWLDYETLCKATTLFDKAIEAAEQGSGKDHEFVQHLRRERLPLEHVWIKGYNTFKRYAENKGEEFCGIANPVELCNNFFSLCEKYQGTAYLEGCTPEGFAKYKENMFLRFIAKPTPIPDELNNLDPNMLMDIQEFNFNIFKRQIRRNNTVVDLSASNGRAMRMPGNNPRNRAEVLIPIDNTHTLFDNTDVNTRFKVVVYVRCDAITQDGIAMTLDIYDSKENKIVAQKNPNVSEIVGPEYHKIEFEPLSLTQSMTIRFTSPEREKEVQAVFVDRIIIIKENSTS